MKRFALLFVVVFACVLPSVAQQHDSDVYFGYAHETGVVGKNGWNFSGGYGLAPHFQAEFDIGGYYGTHRGSTLSDNTHTFLVGPKIYQRHKKGHFTPYGHLLFGFGHNHDGNRFPSSSDAFAIMLGTGADYNFNPQFSMRGKLDLVHTSFFNDGQTNVRLGLGVVYHFGAK